MSDSVPVVEFPTVPSIMLFDVKPEFRRRRDFNVDGLRDAVKSYCDMHELPTPLIGIAGELVLNGVLTPIPAELQAQIEALRNPVQPIGDPAALAATDLTDEETDAFSEALDLT